MAPVPDIDRFLTVDALTADAVKRVEACPGLAAAISSGSSWRRSWGQLGAATAWYLREH